MTGVWAWSAAFGSVAFGLVGRVLLHRFERKQRLAIAAIWSTVSEDHAIAYLEELLKLPAFIPEHERHA